jgi:hypothetical protein
LGGGVAGFGEWFLETRDNLLLMANVPTLRTSAGYVNSDEKDVGGSGSLEKDEKDAHKNEVYDDKGKLQQ